MIVVKIPEDEIFRRPKRQKGDKGGESLIGAASRIGYKNVKAKQYQQEKCKKMEQDEHLVNSKSRAAINKMPFTIRVWRPEELIDLEFKVYAERVDVFQRIPAIVFKEIKELGRNIFIEFLADSGGKFVG